ncbi:ABC transporter permease subunit [Patescibacteria group bacterium]|nr:ABC transporter permease subunit [Patescibacteria group bacterium]
MKKIKQYHHHYHFNYQTTVRRHLTALVLVVAITVLLFLCLVFFINPETTFDLNQISFLNVIKASVNTLTRLTIAYVLSLIFSIPLALVINNPKREKLLLPIFDIVQSVPVLAFFPVIVVFFTSHHTFELAAIFILFMSMLWNLVFTIIGGLKTVPEDVESAAHVFNVKGLRKLWYITLPAIFPYIITGSLLAWGQGWSIIIVAEVLHTYIKNGTMSQDLLGLGSLLVNSFTQGKNSVFILSLSVMIVIITFLNFFVWQKLLHVTQRFKFD